MFWRDNANFLRKKSFTEEQPVRVRRVFEKSVQRFHSLLTKTLKASFDNEAVSVNIFQLNPHLMESVESNGNYQTKMRKWNETTAYFSKKMIPRCLRWTIFFLRIWQTRRSSNILNVRRLISAEKYENKNHVADFSAQQQLNISLVLFYKFCFHTYEMFHVTHEKLSKLLKFHLWVS